MTEPQQFTWRTIHRIEHEVGVDQNAKAHKVMGRLRRKRLEQGGSNPLRRRPNGDAILIQEGTVK